MKKILYISLLIIAFFTLSSCQEKITQKAISYNDFTYTTDQGLTSYIIIITPNEDINNLSINLQLFNQNKEIIFEDTIDKTNLIKNKTYRYEFKYDFLSSLDGKSIKWNYEGYKSIITRENLLNCNDEFIGVFILFIIMVLIPGILLKLSNDKEKKQENQKLKQKVEELENIIKNKDNE